LSGPESFGDAIAAGANALIPIITATIAIAANDIVLFIVRLNKLEIIKPIKCHDKILHFIF
jgi:hypothetical protein